MPNTELKPEPVTLAAGDRAVCFCIFYPAGNADAHHQALEFCRLGSKRFVGTEWENVPIFAFPDNLRFEVVKLSDAEKASL